MKQVQNVQHRHHRGHLAQTAGNGPSFLDYDQARNRLLVTNHFSNNLTVFEAGTMAQVAGSPFATGASNPMGVVASEAP